MGKFQNILSRKIQYSNIGEDALSFFDCISFKSNVDNFLDAYSNIPILIKVSETENIHTCGISKLYELKNFPNFLDEMEKDKSFRLQMKLDDKISYKIYSAFKDMLNKTCKVIEEIISVKEGNVGI